MVSCGQDGLCHGDLGNLELLRLDTTGCGSGTAARVLDRVTAAICARAAAGRWQTGVPGGGDVPGLMYGLAGIGYQLLRLSDPARTPSVLLLHPPVAPAAP